MNVRRHILRHQNAFATVATVIVLALYFGAQEACADDKPTRLNSYAFYSALGSADFASTELALSRGGREANPLPGMQTIGGRAAWKSLSTIGMAELDYLLVRKGKRKTRWGIRAGMVALCAFVVVNNVTVGLKTESGIPD